MNRAILIFVVTLLPMAACSSGKSSPYVDVMQEYDCVYKSFFKQVPRAVPIESTQALTKEGIARVAFLMDESVRQASIIAANRAFESTKTSSSHEAIDPNVYFDAFLDELREELPKHVDFGRCPNVEDLNGAAYDVGVNRYISSIIGNGAMHQWFVDNGGTYVQSAFIATLAGIELSGREVNLDVWKQYYVAYVRRKFAPPQ
jgi:hypothetical protein